MRTETFTLYTFDELPTEKAKDRARDWWRGTSEAAWCEESRGSIKAFCEAFGVSLLYWSVGAYSPLHYRTDAESRHFRGRKLSDFDRDATPTGYYLDCSLWATFYDEFKRTGAAFPAFTAALEKGFKDWKNDLEGQLENEYIDDCLTANEYEFTETGERWTRS